MSANYQNTTSGREILLAITKNLQDTLLKSMQQSKFISILVDDSSDATMKHQLIICVRTFVLAIYGRILLVLSAWIL